MNYNKGKITNQEISIEERRKQFHIKKLISTLNSLNREDIAEIKIYYINNGFDDRLKEITQIIGLENCSDSAFIIALDKVIDNKDKENAKRHGEFVTLDIQPAMNSSRNYII